jgi:hypothetical protein
MMNQNHGWVITEKYDRRHRKLHSGFDYFTDIDQSIAFNLLQSNQQQISVTIPNNNISTNNQQQQICIKYNRQLCSRRSCKYKHVCFLCGNPHPGIICSRQSHHHNHQYQTQLNNQSINSNSINPSPTQPSAKPMSKNWKQGGKQVAT